MACGTCLSLIAQLVKDPVVDPIVQYVSNNIQGVDTTKKEAAILAFGSILDGPDK